MPNLDRFNDDNFWYFDQRHKPDPEPNCLDCEELLGPFEHIFCNKCRGRMEDGYENSTVAT